MIKRPRMYEGLPSEVRETIDAAFKTLTDDLKALDYGVEMGDQAEMLIDQMAEFWLCSNPSFRSPVYANACFYENTGDYAVGCG